MAGLTPDTPQPTNITVHARSRQLEVAFADGKTFLLPFELMRVYSPSAEVKGHGAGQEVLQTGKRLVDIVDLAPVGHYAIQPRFSDGHDSGIFAWDYLYELAENYEGLWAEYLAQLEAAGASRDPEDPRNAPLIAAARAKGSCATH